MSTAFQGSASKYRVVFEGQSLNILPGGVGGTGNFAVQVMASFPTVPTNNPSVGSTAWDTLLYSASQRTFPYFLKAEYAIMVMNGGTSDISTQNNTGAQLYAD